MAQIDLVRMTQSAKSTQSSKTAGRSKTSSEDQNVDFAGLIREHGQKTPTEQKKPAAAESKEQTDRETEPEDHAKQADAEPVISEAMLELQAAMSQLMGLQGQTAEEAQPELTPETDAVAELAGAAGEQEEAVELPVQLAENVAEEQTGFRADAVLEEQPVSTKESSLQRQPLLNTDGEADNALQTQTPTEISSSEKQDTSELRKDSAEQENAMLQAEVRAGALTAENRPTMENPVFTMPKDSVAAETVRTAPETFTQDMGMALADKLPSENGTLTIELEPASLGKLTIKVMYEGGKAAVSILASNPKTLEMLSENAGEIARIMEERTGQDTMIYTPEPQQQTDWNQGGQSAGRERQQDSREERHSAQSESFAQQLRLGLV